MVFLALPFNYGHHKERSVLPAPVPSVLVQAGRRWIVFDLRNNATEVVTTALAAKAKGLLQG